MKEMSKDLKKLLIILGLYSLADGMYYAFQELWMSDNNLSIQTISNVFSICALLSVSVIFLSSNLIKKDKIKELTSKLLFIKAIVMISLFFLNHTELHILIKFLIMIDYVIDVELWASLYPLIALVKKDDEIYAIRDLIYDACYYIGVFIAGILLGKVIGIFNINYNFYILFSSTIIFIAYIILKNIDLTKYNNNEKKSPNALNSIFNKIKEDKISRIYLLYSLTGGISFDCISGLLVLILTEYFSFSELAISNYSIIIGIGAVIIGTIVMKKFTFKNNYVNLTLKYGIRLLIYIITFIFNNKLLFLIAFSFQRLITDSYINISDAPYVNRYSNEEQFAFNNLKEMVDYIATSIGLFFCGIALNYGVRYIFLIGSIFAIMQIIFAYYALYLRNKEGDNNDR